MVAVNSLLLTEGVMEFGFGTELARTGLCFRSWFV